MAFASPLFYFDSSSHEKGPKETDWVAADFLNIFSSFYGNNKEKNLQKIVVNIFFKYFELFLNMRQTVKILKNMQCFHHEIINADIQT